LEKSPNAGIPTTYVSIRIQANSVMVDMSIVTAYPFLNSKAPITIPRGPVVRSKITDS